MTTASDPFAQALDARIAAAVEARVAELQRPSHVTQRTVERVLGLPAITFLEQARAGAFPSSKAQRLVFAKLVDVVAWIEANPVRRPRRVANDTDGTRLSGQDGALRRVGARRVG